MKLVTIVSFWSLLGVANAVAEDATLKMRFVFDGVPPATKHVEIRPAIAPAGCPVVDETLLVDPKSRGIRNVVVYVYTGRGGSKLDLPPHKGEKLRMVMANARFDPHILLARAGDTLELIDRGPNQHNANVNFFRTPPRGPVIPVNQPNPIPMPQPEPAPVPVECNIHPWMRAYIVLLDHPFAAVSDSDGNITIDGLPTETNFVFQVFHEAGRIDRVGMDGVETDWNRGRFIVDLAAGVNDLGDILVPSKSLQPD